MASVAGWTCAEVGQWLADNGFSSYVNLLIEEHQIDGSALLTLTEEDLRQPPLQMTVLGDIKRLVICIRKLQLENTDTIQDLHIADAHFLPFHKNKFLTKRLDSEVSSLVSEDGDTDVTDGRLSQRLEPEYTKLLISYVYTFSVFLLTAFVMVIVNDRVPDMKKYPPLPDLVLDNVPYIPWAFEMCELTGVILFTFWGIILFFHKHRFILMRRMFSMAGTIFLLRCVTMLLTSLSVPGAHLKCAPKANSDMWSKLERAFVIWRGCGMSLQGVRTCGDYMFSGHTVTITLLNFLITEYSPRRMYWLHTTSWVLNIFGIFFILAAHEHYSIDVFVAFYITSRLFLYYHSLANNRALTQRDHKRTRIWFPLFAFFESKCNGMVPNEYEWPLHIPKFVKKMFVKNKQKAP